MAVIFKSRRLNHPKYEVYQVSGVNGMIGYRVKLYCIFCDGRIFHVYNQSDWIDNVNLMRESGSCCSTFTHDLIVTPTCHHSIFKEIRDFLNSEDVP